MRARSTCWGPGLTAGHRADGVALADTPAGLRDAYTRDLDEP